jgi:Ca2+/Na+ antiporter
MIFFIIIFTLCLALLPLSTPAYTAIRVVITLASVAHIFKQKDKTSVEHFPYYALAILYNPIVPIWLDRSTWVVIDLVAIAVICCIKYYDMNKVKKRADSTYVPEPISSKVKKVSEKAELSIDNHISKTQPYLLGLIILLIVITITLKG